MEDDIIGKASIQGKVSLPRQGIVIWLHVIDFICKIE